MLTWMCACGGPPQVAGAGEHVHSLHINREVPGSKNREFEVGVPASCPVILLGELREGDLSGPAYLPPTRRASASPFVDRSRPAYRAQ